MFLEKLWAMATWWPSSMKRRTELASFSASPVANPANFLWSKRTAIRQSLALVSHVEEDKQVFFQAELWEPFPLNGRGVKARGVVSDGMEQNNGFFRDVFDFFAHATEVHPLLFRAIVLVELPFHSRIQSYVLVVVPCGVWNIHHLIIDLYNILLDWKSIWESQWKNLEWNSLILHMLLWSMREGLKIWLWL